MYNKYTGGKKMVLYGEKVRENDVKKIKFGPTVGVI